jgi:CRISPR-associated endonuclease Csn1
MRYTLGIDAGIGSVGWAVLQNDLHGEPMKIERLGVRVFDPSENSKDKATLTSIRRKARGSRRVTRRRKHRKERMKRLITSAGMITREQMDELLSSGKYEKCVYELRVDALERLLTVEEYVRLLIHFARRRGYQSNSKSEEAKDAKKNGKVKQAISDNRQRMQDHGYRTVGEMFWKDDLFRRINPDGSIVLVVHNQPDDYKLTVGRDMLKKEIQLIFAKQREFGNGWASEEFESAYLEIWGSQRNFDEGPGGDSPYGGNQIEKMLGTCTFEDPEPRAPKASYTAEYFRLLQTVNNLKTVGQGHLAEFLNEDQRKTVIEYALTSAEITYGQLRKKLQLPDDVIFNNLHYGEKIIKKPKKKKDSEKNEGEVSKEKESSETVEREKSVEEVEKKKLGQMQFYHKVRIALDHVKKGAIREFSADQLDEIARILTFYKSDDNRTTHLREAQIPEEYIPELLALPASKAAHLSIKAMKKMIPYLEAGYTYDKACTAVYGRHDGKKPGVKRTKKLEISMAGEIYSPVVLRAVSQMIKVINAIVREYGPPEVVRVELAREIGKSRKVRDKLESQQDANAKKNAAIRSQVEEYKKGAPTGQDIVKLKLFQEQNGVCLYSDTPMVRDRLFEKGYAEVDHIIPYSISFDDSYSNKVLVLAGENQEKGSRIPFEYFGHDEFRWSCFETLVNSQIHSVKKRKNLLCRALSEEQIKGFKDRNLKDTQYMSRVIYNLINDHLEFVETGNYKPEMRTQAVKGAITAQVRKRLGIDKARANGDLHHARDAAVIACISPGMIQKITRYSQRCECAWTKAGYVDYETGEVMTKDAYDEKYAPRFPEPWLQFRAELEARLSNDPRGEIDLLKLATYDSDEELRPVFVSKMPNHKVSGPAHEDTIRSGKQAGGTVSKVALTSLKLDETGEIPGYYRPEDDPLLYEALKERLRAFGGEGKKAFAEPFYKPKHNGEPGPVVKKVKKFEKATNPVPVNSGLAKTGKRVRVDVFHVENEGYYFVPIDVADTVKDELPNRAAVKAKPMEQWKEMDESDFLFSLYSGDLIHIMSGTKITMKLKDGAEGAESIEIDDALLYFSNFDIANAQIDVSTHDRRYTKHGMGVKTLSLIEKYRVDVLGNYEPVRLPEKRMRFR